MKNFRGLVILGETLGHMSVDSFLVGEDAFVHDHLRGVADIILADMRNIARLRDKLHSGQVGVQVDWALIAKTLPPRVVHFSVPISSPRRQSSLKSCKRVSRTLSDSAWEFPPPLPTNFA